MVTAPKEDPIKRILVAALVLPGEQQVLKIHTKKTILSQEIHIFFFHEKMSFETTKQSLPEADPELGQSSPGSLMWLALRVLAREAPAVSMDPMDPQVPWAPQAPLALEVQLDPSHQGAHEVHRAREALRPVVPPPEEEGPGNWPEPFPPTNRGLGEDQGHL